MCGRSTCSSQCLRRVRCDVIQAGTTPKSTPVINERANENSRTGAEGSGLIGMNSEPRNAIARILRVPRFATANPARPPSTASAMLSVSNCLIRRVRRAPSASRTEVCILRAVPRASSRFAMFAQAMSSTKPESTISNRRPFSDSLAIAATPPAAGSARIFCLAILLRSASPTVDAPSPLFNHCCNTTVSFDPTCCGEVPDFSRPIT